VCTGDEQALGDVRGRQPAQQKLGDLAFTLGQFVQFEDERGELGDGGLATVVPAGGRGVS